jgi:hypothetical protein
MLLETIPAPGRSDRGTEHLPAAPRSHSAPCRRRSLWPVRSALVGSSAPASRRLRYRCRRPVMSGPEVGGEATQSVLAQQTPPSGLNRAGVSSDGDRRVPAPQVSNFVQTVIAPPVHGFRRKPPVLSGSRNTSGRVRCLVRVGVSAAPTTSACYQPARTNQGWRPLPLNFRSAPCMGQNYRR